MVDHPAINIHRVKALVKEGRLCNGLFYIFLPGFQIGSGWNGKLCRRHTCRWEVQVIDFRYKSNLSPQEICQSLTQIFNKNSFCILSIDFNMFTCADVSQKLNAVKALPGNFQAEFPGFQLIHDPEWQWNPFSSIQQTLTSLRHQNPACQTYSVSTFSRLSRDSGFFRMLGQKVGWDPFAKSWGPSTSKRICPIIPGFKFVIHMNVDVDMFFLWGGSDGVTVESKLLQHHSTEYFIGRVDSWMFLFNFNPAIAKRRAGYRANRISRPLFGIAKDGSTTLHRFLFGQFSWNLFVNRTRAMEFWRSMTFPFRAMPLLQGDLCNISL